MTVIFFIASSSDATGGGDHTIAIPARYRLMVSAIVRLATDDEAVQVRGFGAKDRFYLEQRQSAVLKSEGETSQARKVVDKDTRSHTAYTRKQNK